MMNKNYKIVVDDNHVVYLSKEVVEYYKNKGLHKADILMDIENILDSYYIEDYSELYLKSDGEAWEISYK